MLEQHRPVEGEHASTELHGDDEDCGKLRTSRRYFPTNIRSVFDGHNDDGLDDEDGKEEDACTDDSRRQIVIRDHSGKRHDVISQRGFS